MQTAPANGPWNLITVHIFASHAQPVSSLKDKGIGKNA